VFLYSQVLTALRFFGSGSYQEDISLNRYSGLSQPSISRAIWQVIDSIHSSDLFNEWVKFPSTLAELNRTKERYFYKVLGSLT
jgi:hypothetical protein